MKFWKMLCKIIEETLPDWRDKFLSYKDLKKQLKLIYPKQDPTVDDDDDDDHGNNDKSSKRQRLNDDDGEKKKGKEIDGVDCGEMTKEVTDFVKLLEKEIDKFNAFFIDKEEGYIIKLKVLQDKVGEAKELQGDLNLMKVGREIVDFHGEMVLLENYSALNYTGLVKILKKYDKRSGALIRSPFIQKVLREPFFRIDVIDELVTECEKMLDGVFSLNEPSTQSETTVAKEGCHSPAMLESTAAKERSLQFREELAEIEYMENIYVKAATSALRVLKEIRSGSSTVSIFSLPPLQSSDLEEIWKKAPVVEQEAK